MGYYFTSEFFSSVFFIKLFHFTLWEKQRIAYLIYICVYVDVELYLFIITFVHANASRRALLIQKIVFKCALAFSSIHFKFKPSKCKMFLLV